MLNDINPEDFSSNSNSAMDERLMVRFFIKSKQDHTATLAEGRPIFKDKEYVEIRIPGNRDAQACRPATWADKQRFSKHYEAFKSRISAPEEGTPLIEWPLISRSFAEELAFMHVKTVEQLAELSDTYAGKLHGGYGLKTKAAEWLKKSKVDEEAKAAERLNARIAELEAKLLALDAPQITEATTAPVVERVINNVDATVSGGSEVGEVVVSTPSKRRPRRK